MGRTPLLRIAALALPLFTACEVVEKVQPVSVAEFGLWEDAAGDVADPGLAAVCVDLWNWSLDTDPFWATALGDPRHLGDLPQVSPRARQNDLAKLAAMRERLDALDPARLVAFDREVLAFVQGRVAAERMRLEADLTWTVDPLFGPVVQLMKTVELQPVRTARERELMVKRWEGVASYLRDCGMNLRLGAPEGRISNATAFAKKQKQLDGFLATDPLDSPLVKKATGGGRWVAMPADGNLARIAHDELGDTRAQRELRLINQHVEDAARVATGTRVLIPAADDPLDPRERGELLHAAIRATEDLIYPAAAGYRDTLASLSARARSDDAPGLMHVRGGPEAYRALMAYHTSLPAAECDPAAIHEYGLTEVARNRAEIADVGGRVFGTRDVAEIQRRLRTDPAMHFATRAEIVAKAEGTVRRAEVKVPSAFGLRPHARCIVKEIPALEAPNSTIAYYEAPDANGAAGGRPGIYYVNTYQPATRTRYEAEVLAFHEAVPGHHLQIAIAQEREGLPLVMRNLGSTAFVEGWALYTERLCDELGLYSGDVDRLGMLSFDAWRAARLVVDTGIHAFGWSREQAIRYLTENTLLAPNNVENEVDRYIAWPGQALAYKIGQREILDLRAEARTALGGAFRLAEFHDAVLSHGAVSLETLRGHVHAWIRAQGGALPVEADAPRAGAAKPAGSGR
jgi:uncharacterized protein (DUF885 family)